MMGKQWAVSTAVKRSMERRLNNQCDGCMRGDPIQDGLHINKLGRPYMACESGKYKYSKVNQLSAKVEKVMSGSQSFRFRLGALLACDGRLGYWFN